MITAAVIDGSSKLATARGCGPRPRPARWAGCSALAGATRTTCTRRWTGCCPADPADPPPARRPRQGPRADPQVGLLRHLARQRSAPVSTFGSARAVVTPSWTCQTGVPGHGGRPSPWLDSFLNCNVVPVVQRIDRRGRSGGSTGRQEGLVSIIACSNVEITTAGLVPVGLWRLRESTSHSGPAARAR